MRYLSSDVEHEAFCIAEEIADATGIPRADQRHKDIMSRVQDRLKKFATAILEQAEATPGRLGDG